MTGPKQSMKSHPLKVERELHGWSLAKVAEAVGTNVRTVIRWEQGQSLPYPYYREQLCTLFGKNARELGLLVKEIDSTSVQEKTLDAQLQTSLPSGALFDPAIPSVQGGAKDLVGREGLLASVKQLMWEHDGHSSIAMQGLPGMGKTSLAIALLADPDVRDHFRDGI